MFYHSTIQGNTKATAVYRILAPEKHNIGN